LLNRFHGIGARPSLAGADLPSALERVHKRMVCRADAVAQITASTRRVAISAGE